MRVDEACPPPLIVFAIDAGRLRLSVRVSRSTGCRHCRASSRAGVLRLTMGWVGRLRGRDEVGKMPAGDCEENGRVPWSSRRVCRRCWWCYDVPPYLASGRFAFDMGAGGWRSSSNSTSHSMSLYQLLAPLLVRVSRSMKVCRCWC